MRLILIIIAIISNSIMFAQTYTISGYITDEASGETIVGANIVLDSLNLGAASNSFGFYSLTIPEGVHKITYSYIGYSAQDIIVTLNKNVKQDIEFVISSSWFITLHYI